MFTAVSWLFLAVTTDSRGDFERSNDVSLLSFSVRLFSFCPSGANVPVSALLSSESSVRTQQFVKSTDVSLLFDMMSDVSFLAFERLMSVISLFEASRLVSFVASVMSRLFSVPPEQLSDVSAVASRISSSVSFASLKLMLLIPVP